MTFISIVAQKNMKIVYLDDSTLVSILGSEFWVKREENGELRLATGKEREIAMKKLERVLADTLCEVRKVIKRV